LSQLTLRFWHFNAVGQLEKRQKSFGVQLRPDLLAELKRSPIPPTLLVTKMGKGKGKAGE